MRPEGFWDLQDAFGAAQGEVYAGSGNLREKVISGENLLGISAIGPYPLQWAKEKPTLGVAFLSDYTPAFGRVALINKAAPHPNATRLSTAAIPTPGRDLHGRSPPP